MTTRKFISSLNWALVLAGLLVLVGIVNTIGLICGDDTKPSVVITTGPHAGRTGKVVSSPHLGNLYNLRLTVNVAANEHEIRVRYGDYAGQIEELIAEMHDGHGPREWVKVWSKHTRRLELTD